MHSEGAFLVAGLAVDPVRVSGAGRTAGPSKQLVM